MTTPRISIVVPTHNRPALLLEAVQSIAAQTVAEWEAIVVDDASAPPVDAGALPAPLGRKIRVLRHAASRGGAAAKNTGLREAVAPVVAFLDDDDLYEARYVERALAVLDGHPEIDVVFMAISHVGSRAHEAEQGYQAAMANTLRRAAGTEAEPGVVIFGAALFGALLISIPMAFQRPVVRRTALDEIGEYRPDCLLWDNDWALRAALRGRTALLNEPLYRQRVHDRAFSSRGRKLEQLLSQVETRTACSRRCAKPVRPSAGSPDGPRRRRGSGSPITSPRPGISAKRSRRGSSANAGGRRSSTASFSRASRSARCSARKPRNVRVTDSQHRCNRPVIRGSA
jgi:glycosyltransferase involved in cell wall biosynthesis